MPERNFPEYFFLPVSQPNDPLCYPGHLVILRALLELVLGGIFASVLQLNTNAKDQALAYGVMAQAGNTGSLLGNPVLLAVSAPWAG